MLTTILTMSSIAIHHIDAKGYYDDSTFKLIEKIAEDYVANHKTESQTLQESEYQDRSFSIGKTGKIRFKCEEAEDGSRVINIYNDRTNSKLFEFGQNISITEIDIEKGYIY